MRFDRGKRALAYALRAGAKSGFSTEVGGLESRDEARTVASSIAKEEPAWISEIASLKMGERTGRVGKEKEDERGKEK